MKKKKQKMSLLLAISMCFTILFTMFTVNTQAATTITSNETGTHGGYDYELWKDNGTTSMTLNDGGAFSCSWSNINNALFRKGKKFNETQTHQQLGNISLKYACDYQPNGNSYLAVYGWTSDPLVEYYIIDNWGTWRPPGATSKGTITVDGGTYDVYQTTRVNQPSIKGNTTFEQYWSVRTSKKASGTISVSEHFKAWERLGMKMGKMYEVSLVVEGYQSSGKADVTSMSIDIGGTTNPDPDPNTDPDPIPDYGTRSAFTAIEAEKYNTTTSSTIKVNGNGSGGEAIGYIESGDTITYKDIDFGSGAASFSALVASEQNSNIEIRLGSANGTLLGTLSNISTGSWDTYENKSTTINSVTGLQDIVLVFSGPVNADSFVFSGGNNNNTTKYYGDVNDDGTVNIFDYILLKSFLSGKGTLSSEVAADINIDSSINVIDLVNLKFILTGKRDLQPIKSTGPVTPTEPPKYDKVIALTFDDGPDTKLTPLVLDKLEKYGVPATFMMIGQKVNDSTSAVIKRIINSGCEIGNHSWGFSSMDGMSEADIKKSINDTTVAIQKYSGTTPKFFRAPNLATSNVMFNAIDLTFVNGVTCNDWSQSTTAEQRANDIISGAKDGAILLMHDVQPLPHPTPEALDIIIPTLQKQGYEFVTLSELFKRKGVTLNPTDNKLYTYVP